MLGKTNGINFGGGNPKYPTGIFKYGDKTIEFNSKTPINVAGVFLYEPHEDGTWDLEIRTSGTLTLTKRAGIGNADVCLIGGGGQSGWNNWDGDYESYGAGGGGGGSVFNIFSQSVAKGEYSLTMAPGTATRFGELWSASGGNPGIADSGGSASSGGGAGGGGHPGGGSGRPGSYAFGDAKYANAWHAAGSRFGTGGAGMADHYTSYDHANGWGNPGSGGVGGNYIKGASGAIIMRSHRD